MTVVGSPAQPGTQAATPAPLPAGHRWMMNGQEGPLVTDADLLRLAEIAAGNGRKVGCNDAIYGDLTTNEEIAARALAEWKEKR